MSTVTTYVALAADHLVAVELGGQSLERGLDDTTTEAENQVEGGLLFNPSACRPIHTPQTIAHPTFTNAALDNRLPLLTHLLDVVVGESSAILELLASKDQSLLVRGNALLVLDLGLDIVNGVRGLDLKGDGLARQGLHETEWRLVSI